MFTLHTLIDGNAETFEEALENGLDINKVNSNGDTYLAWAIRGNHPKAARLLIDHGADIDKPTAHGSHMLPLAEAYHRTDIADMLRDATETRRQMALAAAEQAEEARLHTLVLQRRNALRDTSHQYHFRPGARP